MEKIISGFINGAISPYMTQIKKDDVTASLARKYLEITELDIFPDALLQHGIPLIIKKGTIRNVNIEFTTKIKTEPIVIIIDSVTILATLCNHNLAPSEIINMKIRLLKAYKFFRKQYKMILGMLGKDSFLEVARTIMSRIIISIKKIHIQIEYSSQANFDASVTNISVPRSPSKHDDTKSESTKKEKRKTSADSEEESSSDYSTEDELLNLHRFSMYDNEQTDQQKVTSIGVIITDLKVHNPPNLEQVSADNIVKEAIFTKLGVYMEADVSPIPKERMETEMEKLFKSNEHNWILEPFSFLSLIKYKKDDSQIFFDPIIKNVNVNFREDYIPVVMNLLNGFTTFQKRFSVAHIPRPSPEQPQDFWNYVHQCAVAKISNAAYDFSQSLCLLVQRSIFLKNYKKKDPESLNIIRQMEEKLDYSTIVAFRAAYRLIHRKKKKPKGKSMITTRTTDKILKVIKIDPVQIITGLVGMIAVNFTGDSLEFVLRNNRNKKHIIVDMINIRFSLGKDLKSYLINAVVSYINVKFKRRKHKEKTLFKSIKNNNQLEMKIGIKIPFRSYSTWSFSLDVSKNNYTIYLESVLQLLSDLSFLQLFASDEDKPDIIGFIKKINFELNVSILTSVIKIVGSHKNRAIQYAFDKLLFSTDSKTFERTIKLSNSWVSLITDNEVKVSSDFNLSGKMIEKNLSISIPMFSFAIPFKHVVVIEDFVGLFIKYKNLFTISSLPKLDINVDLDMKGMRFILKSQESGKSKSLKMKELKLLYKDSQFKFTLTTIKLSKLFALNDMNIDYDGKKLNFKIESISAKVMQLLSLLPTDAFQVLQNKNTMANDTNSDSDSETYTETETYTESVNSSQDILQQIIDIPEIKINFAINDCNIDLSDDDFRALSINAKDIKADGNNKKLTAGVLLNKITFEEKEISQPIELKSEITIAQTPEILVKIGDFNFGLTKELIDFFFSLKMPKMESVPIPPNLSLKFKLIFNQIALSKNFVINKITAKGFLNNAILDLSAGIGSVDSSFIKFNSKDLVKMNADINNKAIDLEVNLEEITVFIIPLMDVLAMIPSISSSSVPQLKLKVKVKPLQCSMCFGEDYLNVSLNSPLKFKLNTLDSQMPYVYLKLSKFLINLNNNEIFKMRSLKFELNKDLTIDIPSVTVTVSMLKMYTLIKMISYIAKSSLVTSSKANIAIYEIPIESITAKIPLIEIIIHQTKSKRCLSITFNNTELYLKNGNAKSDFYASMEGFFGASDGILSFNLTPPFKITSEGTFSEKYKNCIVESKQPIQFEISTYVINQILKNLTATEDEVEEPYSIVNETGTKITIYFNKHKYKLEPQEILANIKKFSEADIKVKIGKIKNPIKIYSAFSRISFPLFFEDHCILVWLDTNKLQLRLLSPLSFKNKSNVDLSLQLNDEEISLKNGKIYCLDYNIGKIENVLVKYKDAQQEINLHENSVVNLNNTYIVITKRWKMETLHTSIVFTTPYYFRNELIYDLTISFEQELDNGEKKKQEVLLHECDLVPFPFSPPTTEKLSFDILDTEDIKGVHVDLQINDMKDNKYYVKTVDKNGNDFILQFTLTIEKSNIISISPLLIYYNSLSIPLKFGLSSDEKLDNNGFLNLDDDLATIFPFQNSDNIWKANTPIMFSPPQTNEQNEDKTNIYITTKYSSEWVKEPFILNKYEIIEDLTIPLNTDKICMIHYHILSNSHYRPNTNIFFIAPKYVINNQTNETFSLNLFDGQFIEIPPNSALPVTLIRESHEISIALVPKSKSIESSSTFSLKKQNLVYSRKLNIDTIYNQYLKLASIDSPVLLHSTTEKEITFISIMLNRTLPYKFINNSDYKAIFVQKDTSDFTHTVMPFESLSFFIFDETKPEVIICECKDHTSFQLDVNKPTFPVKVELPNEKDNEESNLYYYVDTSIGVGSSIILCNAIDNEISINTKDDTKDESSFSINVADIQQMKNNLFNVSVNFNQLSFLIITSQFQELCNITLKDIMIESSIYDYYTLTQVALGTIKIDDQNPYAVYPSILQILPSGNQPAIYLKIKSFGNNKYGKIETRIRPISIQIDLSFLSDFIGDIFYMTQNTNPLNDDETNEDLKSKISEFKMNDVSITEIIKNLMPKEVKYHINNLAIHPFIIHLSFRTKTERSLHPLQKKFQFNGFYNVIPSFDNAKISIDEYHSFKNLNGTADEIVFKIEHDIKTMVLNQLSLTNNILGQKKKLQRAVTKLIKRPESNEVQGNDKKLPSVTLVLSVAESTLSYLSSMLDLYTETPSAIRTDETSFEALSWGASTMISSFSKAAKSLISEPIKRGRVNGKIYLCGYVAGTGIGVTKCAAHVASGMCCFGASLFSGARRVIHKENVAFVDKREHEPSLGLHSVNKEPLLWFTGSVFSDLIEAYPRSIFILNEHRIISNIMRVQIDGNSVTIFDVNQQKYVSSFDDYNKAVSFYNIIESQLLRKKIINIDEQSDINNI